MTRADKIRAAWKKVAPRAWPMLINRGWVRVDLTPPLTASEIRRPVAITQSYAADIAIIEGKPIVIDGRRFIAAVCEDIVLDKVERP